MSHQIQLLNTATMTSTKAMRAAQRAKAAATTTSKSETTAAGRMSAGIAAAPADSPTRSPERLSEKLTPKLDRRISSSAEIQEFNLPDEDRKLCTLIMDRCEKCGQAPQVVRKSGRYKVQCFGKNCEPTPLLKSSAAAINHWRLTAKLTQ